MPFSSTVNVKEAEWTETYEKFLRPAMESFGFSCKRSEIGNRPITKYIVQDLKNSHMVVADLTDCNPNVMWELGVRHSLSPKTIMIASEKMKGTIPSDLFPYGLVFYKEDRTAYSDFVKDIANVLDKMEKDPANNSGPVFDSLKMDELTLLSFERRQILNKLTGLMSETAENIRIANKILNEKNAVNANNVIAIRFHLIGLEKLITDNYITMDTLVLNLILKVRKWIQATNGRLDIIWHSVDIKQRETTAQDVMKETAELKTDLIELMREFKKIHTQIKSGSMNEREAPLLITDEIAKQVFEKEKA